MRQKSTLFLKFILVMISLPILALCLYALPVILMDVFHYVDAGKSIGYIFLGVILLMYCSAIPYFFSLYQAYKLLRNIDTGMAFSQASVAFLKKIRKSAFLIAVFYSLAFPLLVVVARWEDAPGIAAIGLVIVGASCIIGIFAVILENLLQEAIAYKKESELII